MARFKPVRSGLVLLPVDFDKQIQPGSFEYALCHLIDHDLDLQPLRSRICNDDGGAPAYDPASPRPTTQRSTAPSPRWKPSSPA